MLNHDASSETEFSTMTNQRGGANELKPTGGFPPIYIMEKKDRDNKHIKQSKKVYEKPLGTTVSIKDILHKRRYGKPFSIA